VIAFQSLAFAASAVYPSTFRPAVLFFCKPHTERSALCRPSKKLCETGARYARSTRLLAVVDQAYFLPNLSPLGFEVFHIVEQITRIEDIIPSEARTVPGHAVSK
jgi:hypothetical protein